MPHYDDVILVEGIEYSAGSGPPFRYEKCMVRLMPETKDVYREGGVFAGWPANHGAWQWENECLVGFIRGKYGSAPMHNVIGPLEFVQARSFDYGHSWTLEKTNIPEAIDESELMDPPSFDLQKTIIRIRGTYDHGGERVPEAGCFYLSEDRGGTWTGPYWFDGLEAVQTDEHNTSRTCVADDMVFLSKAKANHWASDEVFVARHDGERFHYLGDVTNFNGVRAVMPAVAQNERIIYCATRRRFKKNCWIDLHFFNGHCWEVAGKIADTGPRNGNPPALLCVDDILLCAYADRGKKQVLVRASRDGGATWREPITLYSGRTGDLGYPRLFIGSYERAFCVYYAEERGQASILSTHFSLAAF